MAVTDATMAERSARPLSPAAWKAQLLVVAGLILSSIAHVALLGTVLFARPGANNAPPTKSITVDLVPEKNAPPAAKPEIRKSLLPKPAIEKPAQEKRAQQKPTPQSPPPAAKEPETTMALASASPAPSPNKATQPEPRTLPPQAMTENTEANTAAAAAARLAHLLHLKEVDPSTTFEAPPSKNRARLSRKEVAAFKAHLKKCWTPPAGVPRTDKVKVVLRVALSPQGKLTNDPVLLAGSPSIHGPALFKSALDALAQCQPYATLPARKYQEWKRLDLSFTPADILAIDSGAGFGSARVTR